jgi:hypothetical protein
MSTSAGTAPKRRATSYARTAHIEPGALECQHAQNLAAAARDGFERSESVPDRWDDAGWSGRGTTRPGFGALLALVESGEADFSRVYVADRTRLVRSADPRAGYELVARFARHRVEVVFVTDNPPIGAGDLIADAFCNWLGTRRGEAAHRHGVARRDA